MTDPADCRIIHPVLLSGGAGVRLWPMSRERFPKQLLNLTSDLSMIQETALRVADPARFATPLVICNEEHRFVIAEQLREAAISPAGIILEPVGRNTAAAVAVAALRIAETGYGYIRRGERLESGDGFRVAAFVEKPSREKAQSYIDGGDHFWNSGMFLFPVGKVLAELERFVPEVLAACRQALSGAATDLDFCRLGAAAFAASPSISIDYAVMERTDSAVMVPADIGWTDVGAWSALWEVGAKDENGNVRIGDVLSHDSHNCYIRSETMLTTAVGMEDAIIVVTDDVVMVAARDRVGEIKTLVEELKRQGRTEPLSHRKVHRPWGFYQFLHGGDRFQVKRLTVNPGARLSLQLHYHRAEHWVVVNGTALVTRGSEQLMLRENESIFIPLGTPHRLENPGRMPLNLIEVQSGAYLGEDDIVRLDDTYGRA